MVDQEPHQFFPHSPHCRNEEEGNIVVISPLPSRLAYPWCAKENYRCQNGTFCNWHYL